MAIDYAWLEEKILRRSLNDNERGKLDRLLIEKQVAKGERIATQGQSGGKLYIIRSGKADIVVEKNGETRQIGSALGEGALIGWMSFLNDEPAAASVNAGTDCVVYRLNRADCNELMASDPEIVYSFLAYIVIYSGTLLRKMNDDNVQMMLYMTSSHK